MDWSAALPTFVITLREGVEATLVIGIVLAYLSKAGRSQLHFWVYIGAIAGLLASIGVGLTLAWVLPALATVDPRYSPIVKPLLEGIFGLAAIAMLSWMLIWMTRQARQMKAEVEKAVTASLASDQAAGWGIFTLIFFAVLREGFETVLFLAANYQQSLASATGALAGLLGAIAIGVLLFQLGVKINLRQFFQVMGIFLLLIVAGLAISSIKEFDIALYRYSDLQGTNLCWFGDSASTPPSCLMGPLLWDTSHFLPARQFPGIILRMLFGYTDHLFLIQAVAYISFLSIIGTTYFRSLGNQSSTQSKPAPLPLNQN